MLEKNPGTVKLVLKNMPLQSKSHQYSEPAARAALAAREQDKYWEFHDALFAKKQFNLTDIDNIAIRLGLNMSKFKKDMISDAVKNQVQQDLIQAQQAGVGGTPTVFINGRLFHARSLEWFQRYIDQELEMAKAKKQ